MGTFERLHHCSLESGRYVVDENHVGGAGKPDGIGLSSRSLSTSDRGARGQTDVASRSIDDQWPIADAWHAGFEPIGARCSFTGQFVGAVMSGRARGLSVAGAKDSSAAGIGDTAETIRFCRFKHIKCANQVDLSTKDRVLGAGGRQERG